VSGLDEIALRNRALSPELTTREQHAFHAWSRARRARQVEARRVESCGWMADQEAAMLREEAA
jgi:hypothetical protein